MKSINITVAGQNFQIRSDADEEYVQELAREITSRYSEIVRSGSRHAQEFKGMAMVAIAILDEMRTTEKKCESIKMKAKHFASQMISKIDRLLSGEST